MLGWERGAVSQQVPSNPARLRVGRTVSAPLPGQQGPPVAPCPCGWDARGGRFLGTAQAQPGLLEVPFGWVERCPLLPSSPHLRVGRFRQQHRRWGQAPSLHGS